MEQTATICGGQVWKALFKGAPSSLDKKVKRMGGRREEEGRYKFVSSRDELQLRQHFAPLLAPMLVVVSRENITTMAAAHKFVTAVLQMASSIFPARPFLLPRPRSARILHRGAGWIRGPPMSIRGRRAEISATGRIGICDWLDFVTFMPTCDRFVIVEKWSPNLISD